MDQYITIQSPTLNVAYLLDPMHKLGNGCFAEVYLAYLSTDQTQKFACKILSKKVLYQNDLSKEQREKYSQRIMAEFNSVMKCNHPNIIKFIDRNEDANNCYLISEYCDGQTLESIKQNVRIIPEQTVIPWVISLVSAIHYLHTNNIIHRDIKPSNIMFHNNIIKLIDFGFAKIVDQQDGQMTTGLGAPKYMAPELLDFCDDYDQNVDIWALGWTLFELLYGQDPWDVTGAQDYTDILNRIEAKPLKFPSSIAVSDAMKNMLKGMLCIEPHERVNSAQLILLSQQL